MSGNTQSSQLRRATACQPMAKCSTTYDENLVRVWCRGLELSHWPRLPSVPQRLRHAMTNPQGTLRKPLSYGASTHLCLWQSNSQKHSLERKNPEPELWWSPRLLPQDVYHRKFLWTNRKFKQKFKLEHSPYAGNISKPRNFISF